MHYDFITTDIEVTRAGSLYLNGTSIGFNVKEFVPPDIYKHQGNYSISLMQYDTLRMARAVREYFGTTVWINTWPYIKAPGEWSLRGWRPMFTTLGAHYSRHKYGMAIDFNVRGLPAEHVCDQIIGEEIFFYVNGVRRMEDISLTPTWTHIDCAATGLGEFEIYIIE